MTANLPFGLRPINDNGTAWTGQGRMIAFNTDESNNIFLGDPIVPTGATDGNGVPYMTLATGGATNTVAGGFIGLCNGPAKGANSSSTLLQSSNVYRTASVLTYGFVCDDPNQLYAIQEDSVGGAIAAANAGYTNGNLITGSGSTVTGYSGWQLDSSTVDGNANPTYQLRILGLLRGPDNAIGNYAKWVVRLNLPALWALSGY